MLLSGEPSAFPVESVGASLPAVGTVTAGGSGGEESGASKAGSGIYAVPAVGVFAVRLVNRPPFIAAAKFEIEVIIAVLSCWLSFEI